MSSTCCLDGCEKPAVGKCILASEEDLKSMPHCAEHLAEIERQNQEYEARVARYVEARIKIPQFDGSCLHKDAVQHRIDLAETSKLWLRHRREILAAEDLSLKAGQAPFDVDDRVPICRDGKSEWIRMGELSAEEMGIQLETHQAWAWFYGNEVHRNQFKVAAVLPFMISEDTTYGQAQEAMKVMIAKRLADFPGLTPEQHAAEVMRLHYQNTAADMQPRILQAYVEEFTGRRPQ